MKKAIIVSAIVALCAASALAHGVKAIDDGPRPKAEAPEDELRAARLPNVLFVEPFTPAGDAAPAAASPASAYRSDDPAAPRSVAR